MRKADLFKIVEAKIIKDYFMLKIEYIYIFLIDRILGGFHFPPPYYLYFLGFLITEKNKYLRENQSLDDFTGKTLN